jgi:DNA-binding transcriptional ArsR family regulator
MVALAQRYCCGAGGGMSNANETTRKAIYLSHFTPSMMPAEALESMLVQREPLLKTAVESIISSVTTGSRHHQMFVGPRGIGKTHLISLIHHRISQNAEIKDKALIAWMREEEWGVTSFFELVMRILRTLDASYPELNITERTKPFYELTLDVAAEQAETLLLDVLANKCLIILLENLDDLFDQIGDHGQKAWRAFIQNHNNMMLVCTTPSLFAGVSIHKSAFYGFFDIEPLVELEFEDVVSLLRKIAVERGDAFLATFIDTPEGRARIRAVHHLAEGNPRIYIIFAQFLSQEALDELVQAFMHTLDELTPYYQARMKELPGQQRKIAEYLVHYRGAAPVKAIAKACFITQQVCSSQLKQLKDKRYVRSIEKGRTSFYELCEPLMRLCMEVKKQQGEPVSLFVEILRIWYTQAELEKKVSNKRISSLLELEYVQRALSKYQTESSDPKILAVMKDLEKVGFERNIKKFFSLIEELRSVGGNVNAAMIRIGMRMVNWADDPDLNFQNSYQDEERLTYECGIAMGELTWVAENDPKNTAFLSLAIEERKLVERFVKVAKAMDFEGKNAN